MIAVASPDHLVDSPRASLTERNRWTLRVLLAIVLVLAVATLLRGIRW